MKHDHLTSGTWLISFADLITLVLCTFIMFFAQTYQVTKPAQKSGTEVAISNDSQKKVVDLLTPKVVDGELVITVNDVSKEGFLTSESNKFVKKLVESGNYASQKFEIKICHGEFWESVASNLIGILTRLGVGSSDRRVSFFGTDCKEITTKGEPEIVAKLRVLNP